FGSGTIEWILLVLTGSGLVLVGHTAQIWLWSGAILYMSALKSFSDAMYFSLVTTTTLGYGDITLGPEHRIFGAMGAVSGLMTFGLSTAFLINLVSAVLGQPQ
ncbi:MAG: potassium channel family protein, partial [Pseudomonadota bacterium]